MTDWMLLAAGAAGGHGGSEGPHALFNLFGLDVTSEITTEWAVIALIAVLGFIISRDLRRIPGGIQAAAESAVNAVVDTVIAPSIGGREKAIRYLPFLGTLFLFIIVSNYVGLLPGAVLEIPGFKPPTSAISVTAALAILAFIATHYAGLREKGLSYFKHFLQPYAFLLPLNLIEEVIRPLSLALRLFGNIFGEEMTLLVLLGLVPMFVPVPIMALDLLFGFLQAFIFTMLTATYIGGAIAEHH